MKDFDSLLMSLEDDNKSSQATAAECLARFQLTSDQGVRLIAAAARTYPNDSYRTYETLGAMILRACWEQPHASYVTAVKEHYAALAKHESTQWQSLRILTELKTVEALQAFVELLYRNESRSISLELPLVPLIGSFWGSEEPRPAMSALFPAWFNLVDHLDDVHRVYSLISACHSAGLLDYQRFPQFVADSIQRAKRDLRALQVSGPQEQSPLAERAALELEWLLDLFSYMEHDEVPHIIKESLDACEPQVQLFAVAAGLPRNVPVPDKLLESLAASPSKRYRLWQLLEKCGHLQRFPVRYWTTQSLAEANMVRWLEFPTEMGRPPEEIEHLTAIKCDDDTEAHFFKFRHSDFLDGKWFVGYAGRYPVSHLPTTLDGDGTFSQFDEFNAKSLEEHVADYLDDHEE